MQKIERLEQLRQKIESLEKFHQTEILKILHEIYFSFSNK